MNTSSIIYRHFRGSLVWLALVLALAGCDSVNSSAVGADASAFSAALAVSKATLKPGETTDVYASLKNQPGGLRYRWVADRGQFDPQESEKEATTYTAPSSFSEEGDLTVNITLEFVQGGNVIGKKQASIIIKREEITQQQGKDTAPITAASPTEPKDPTYPKIENPQRLTRTEVRRLAEFYGLTQRRKVNPHLRFLEGDISYWFEQRLSEDELKLEFESRRIILDRAEKSGEVISTQGDLSYLAETEQPDLKLRRR